jgi:hypothetical protein
MKKLLALLLLVALPAFGQVASRDYETSSSQITPLNSSAETTTDGQSTGTIAFWVKLESNNIWQTFVSTGNSSDTDQFLSVGATDTGLFRVNHRGTSTSLYQWIRDSSSTLTTGTWYFLAIIQDGVEADLYINGSVDQQSMVGSTNWDGSEWTDDANIDTDVAGIGYLRRSSVASPMDGLLAYVQWWNRALSVPELLQSMHCPGSVADELVWFYPLTDSSTQYDYSVTSTSSTSNTSTASTDGPPIGGCYGGQSIGVQ